MPPTPKHNLTIVLYDVNNSPEFAEEAQHFLLNVSAWKYCAEPNDRMKLIYIGTEETNNILSVEYDGKCPNISDATDFIYFNVDFLQPHLNKLADIKKANGNWIFGLLIALQELTQHDHRGVITFQVLLLTDFSVQCNVKEKQIEFLINDINKLGAYLYIFGPKVKVPKHMTTFKDIRKWSKNLEYIDSMENNQNLAAALRLIQSCNNAVMCDLKMGMDLFKCFCNPKSMQPWNVPLTLGSNFTISTSTVRIIKPLQSIKFKLEVSSSWGWCLAEDIAVDVSCDNTIGGITMHGRFESLPTDIVKNFKYSGPRSFKIVAFTLLSSIPEYYLSKDGVFSVVPIDEGDQAYHVLLKVLNDQKKCAIVERIYMQNCRPKLMALIPQKDDFVLVELPYSHRIMLEFSQTGDDKPSYLKEELVTSSEKATKRKVLYEYLEKMDISNPYNVDENGSIRFPLSPLLMDSIKYRVMMNQTLEKYSGKSITEDNNLDLYIPQLVTEDISEYKKVFAKSIPKKEFLEQLKKEKSEKNGN